MAAPVTECVFYFIILEMVIGALNSYNSKIPCIDKVNISGILPELEQDTDYHLSICSAVLCLFHTHALGVKSYGALLF
jgi:hypothetical protein